MSRTVSRGAVMLDVAIRHYNSRASARLLRMAMLLLLFLNTIKLISCEGYLSAGPGAPCVGTIHLLTNSSTSLSLIRDKRWSFYTENSHSQYHTIPSKSFALVARDTCRIVYADPLFRKTCRRYKDADANIKCLQVAQTLSERAITDPAKTIETWNRQFEYFNRPLEPSGLTVNP